MTEGTPRWIWAVVVILLTGAIVGFAYIEAVVSGVAR